MTIDLGRYLVFLLVMLRMTGLFVANPIFGRSNVPTMVNVGISFVISVLLFTSMSFPSIPEPNLIELVFMAVRELAIGMLAGFMIRLFLSIAIIGGEIIDMQLGLSMAKNFDPGTNASVSVSANLLNAMFVLCFFYTNNHLTLIGMTAQTFQVLPVGTFGFHPAGLFFLPDLFSSVMIYAIKLCMPMVVIEVITTLAVGIIMRIIPQINVFVVNIQFKMLIGFFVLIVMVVPFMAFCENMLTICFEQIAQVWRYFLV